MSHYVTLSLVRGEERVLYTIRGEAVLRIVLAVPLPNSMSKFKIYFAVIVFLCHSQISWYKYKE